MLAARFAVFLIFHSIWAEERDKNTYGMEWVTFADDGGKPHYINLTLSKEVIKDIEYSRRINGEPKFWLYTREILNDPEELLVPNKFQTHFIPSAPIVILVGGWFQNRDSDFAQLIKNAILNDFEKITNVVVMDWYDMQSWHYILSAKATMQAAEKLKQLVQYLVRLYHIDGSKLHLIGHSLGAHVVGLAGSKLKENNLIISRVTGLDPARPFFEVPVVYPGISKNSAAFVDIIHTNAAVLGIYGAVGHADFYPGGGQKQPAFCPFKVISGICEHSSSYRYFEKSLTKHFQAHKCPSYIMYSLGFCNANEIQYMGEPCEPTARGSFFLNVYKI